MRAPPTLRASRPTVLGACALVTFSLSARVWADEPATLEPPLDGTTPGAPNANPETPPVAPVAPVAPGRPVLPRLDPELPPTPLFQDNTPSTPRLKDSEHFTIDPVLDGLLVVGGFTFSELLSLIISTGEIKPQPPGDPNRLLSIDRGAVNQTIDPNADKWSTVGLWTAYGYAVLDPVLSGVRAGRRAFFVDAIMYAESSALTQALTSATKIAVRRPRPLDYANCYPTNNPDLCSSTDLQLSFFSGHASGTAAIAATATYLAFVRSGPRSARPWITLGLGTALTAFVSYERVRSGYHFPTDVLMGSMAGAGIGILVPHLHHHPHYHEQELESPPVIIGYAPSTNGGHSLTFQWKF